ncbi:5-oxoprolinase (ATP-hydrolysing) [Desulfatibacillum alkenivorans DSM 16219]|uniref:5-oxoprolinase (ATP-hydrolysing) n=1 Tax=Desulfatibacillum alkenivorans DSM 16219 TaxID=1121393 RepID=A0A1M6MPY6_9BACT|nr:hydantoinase B/oxoprolinase family protein [Desulfatibacillum alkenivorans]SHJ85489.1 5-oxoprolinase (ATP-hydrolysing) [Desulfatibacillum alkenivorans DSM 16219]
MSFFSERIMEYWIDVGGTFTDCLAWDGKTLSQCKVLSSGGIKGEGTSRPDAGTVFDRARKKQPDDFFTGYEISILSSDGAVWCKGAVLGFSQGVFNVDPPLPKDLPKSFSYELTAHEPAPILGIRMLAGLGLKDAIGQSSIRLGTTRGTNALLERKGGPAALAVTEGFGDLLSIGAQARPELFSLDIEKPEPLFAEVVEIPERINAWGEILKPLDAESVRPLLKDLIDQGVDSLAVCLLNSYANPCHEQELERLARSLGFDNISVSSALTPTIKALDRGDTAMVDAYLAPVLSEYISLIRSIAPDAEIKIMTSAGGLVEAERFQAKDSVLSGPAGGVVGFADIARSYGRSKAIGFDMGGTSTDVSRFDGEYETQFSAQKAGVRIVAPMMAIETVAAGGGSICQFDGVTLSVGPGSAGSHPGPACYGRGGPLTVTDVNYFCGKVSSDHFPFPLHLAPVEKLLREMAALAPQPMTPHELALGFLQVANRKMADAVKRISAAKGYDPRDYLLVAFGGAGPQHACSVARELGVREICAPGLAGVLSAWGIGAADVRSFREESFLRPLDSHSWNPEGPLVQRFQAMEKALVEETAAQGIFPENIKTPVRIMDLRYKGEETAISIRCPKDGDWTGAFESRHQQLYGHVHQGREIEIAAIRAECVGSTPRPEKKKAAEIPRLAVSNTTKWVWFDGLEMQTFVYDESMLRPGDRVFGPAMITQGLSTVIIDPGFEAVFTGLGDIIIRDLEEGAKSGMTESRRDPVTLSLFNHHFQHIASQMGVILRRTALSVNVKERLDFSCAILDSSGNLVVNAPHIPVHLGAMSRTVQSLLGSVKDIRPGDVYLTNHPALGGSHLPDLTVMTPVFDDEGRELRFFTASRAHHAEIGGVQPGSCYPFAENLAQEGVIFSHLRICREGRFLETELMQTLTQGPYPSRNPRENIADIRAAIAANQTGARELIAMTAKHSWKVVKAYMGYIRDAAEEKTRAALRALPDGMHVFRDALDDGAQTAVAVTIEGDAALIDFSGTGPVNANSLNASEAVVTACVLYCLRCLIQEDIPLNSGVLAPVKIINPTSMLNPPGQDDPTRFPGVVGGNVELSQKVVDILLGALGVAAASQGTMNNFIFGNENLSYYETICGGAGAGPGFDGAHAVHTHMTNTRITDVEILERRYPVLVRQFCIRRGSGGEGEFTGGCGAIRAIEFLEPMEISLLTQRRTSAPFGLMGGLPGAPGQNLIIRKGAIKPEALPSLAQTKADPGDVLIIKTPGGGGFGRPKK